ncbi:MAG: hypothetical protein ACPLTR_10425 [Thermacetogeniaceae bacterium]
MQDVYQPPAPPAEPTEPKVAVAVENPQPFSIPSGGVVTAKLSSSDAPVKMQLTAVAGVPENVRVEVAVGGAAVAVVEGGQIITSEPFTVDGAVVLEIRLSAAGRAVLEGAKLHFERVA